MRMGLMLALLVASPAAAVEFADFEFEGQGHWQTYEVRIAGGTLVDGFASAVGEFGRNWWENFGDEENPNWVIWGNEYLQFSTCSADECGPSGYLRNFQLNDERFRFTYVLPRSYARCPTSPKIPFAVCGETWYPALIQVTVGYEGERADLAVSAVPEPATWAMMIAGFGLVGGMVRRRRVLPA